MAMLVVADTTTIMTMKGIPMSMVMTAAVVMSMSTKNILMHTATSAAVDTTTAMSMNTHTLTRTATNVAADMITKSTLMRTVTNVVATTVMSTSTLTHMVTNAVADMTTATNMLMYTDITFPVILLTVIAKSAIRMRNTAMYAAKAWLIAPAVCRMPTR